MVPKIDGKREAEKLYTKYQKMWEDIGYNLKGGNNPSIFGGFFEGLVMKFIDEKIKGKNLKIKKGLIKNESLKQCPLSPQVDIIIYSGRGLYECPITNTAIVKSEQVKLIIEVKSYLDKPTIVSSKTQIEKIKNWCPAPVKSCVFAYALSMRVIDEDKIKSTLFDFCDNFVVLRRYNKDVYDYGGGLTAFLNTLNNL
ncbi:MAG: DUF6602 domain-containing protein [Elusimicrobiota bacterium]